MKKILLATTMLAGFAGAASAEMTMSGSAVMGFGTAKDSLGYYDDTMSKMETYVTFTGTGTTDGGLEFGMSSTLATYETNGDFANDGTTAYVSGAFGKLSMGSVGEADAQGGISDIGGIAGLGVDNVAEVFDGDSVGGAHNVNYTYSAGAFTVSASTNFDDDGVWAVGGKYNFGDYYVGLGYGADDYYNDSTTSVYAGGVMGAVKVDAMYSSFDDGSDTETAMGLSAAYTTGALTISASIADNSLMVWDEASDEYVDGNPAFGIGAAYDLGGGLVVTGGVASVENRPDSSMDGYGNDYDSLVWEAGVSMTF
jgi:outer membrane protein OmpU